MPLYCRIIPWHTRHSSSHLTDLQGVLEALLRSKVDRRGDQTVGCLEGRLVGQTVDRLVGQLEGRRGGCLADRLLDQKMGVEVALARFS